MQPWWRAGVWDCIPQRKDLPVLRIPTRPACGTCYMLTTINGYDQDERFVGEVITRVDAVPSEVER